MTKFELSRKNFGKLELNSKNLDHCPILKGFFDENNGHINECDLLNIV